MAASGDHTNNNKIVWQSGTILFYFCGRFDKTGKFVGKDLDERSDVSQ